MSEQFQFHVGYDDYLHPVPAVNFQLNRWIAYLGESAREELQAIASRLVDFPSYRREFHALAEKALAEGRKLHAAYYFRSAEFFMWHGDPDKLPTRARFLQLIREYYGITARDTFAIPYQDGNLRANLHAYRFTPAQPGETLVIFGGFDSYIEEFLPILLALRDRGFDVVCFEGPGQGHVLQEYGLPMTPDWHKPVKAVLDFFNLREVTLLGISMGGCLVMRAAAYEPRARRVIAFDVLYDMLAMRRNRVKPFARFVLQALFHLHAAGLYNHMLQQGMKENMQLDWAVHQGMYVHGVKTPYEYVRKTGAYRTGDISHLITQDVLLLAGSEDFAIPPEHFYQQIAACRNVRSLTARMFTRAEHAQNHCQVGNLELAVDFITNWISFSLKQVH